MFAQLGREMRRGIIKKLEAAMRSTSIAFLARSISPSCEQGEGGGEQWERHEYLCALDTAILLYWGGSQYARNACASLYGDAHYAPRA